MKICLVTSFPPSRRGLNEYGYHIARELQNNPLLSLTVLADELPSPEPELPGFSVVRCWDFNRVTNPLCLLREIRQLQPDVTQILYLTIPEFYLLPQFGHAFFLLAQGVVFG